MEFIEIFAESCFEVEDDFQHIFLSKSGIHISPHYVQLKLSERTINSTHYHDLFILEPKKYYFVQFSSDIDLESQHGMLKYDVSFMECGLIVMFDYKKKRFYLYNATENIVYLQQGTKIGEVFYG